MQLVSVQLGRDDHISQLIIAAGHGLNEGDQIVLSSPDQLLQIRSVACGRRAGGRTCAAVNCLVPALWFVKAL